MPELRRYQQEGRDFLLARSGAVLADDMGLGKTGQAVCAMGEILRAGGRALIICPATLKINWKREFQLWAPQFSVEIVQSGKSQITDADVTIINYDLLKAKHEDLRVREWAILVCDEAHYLKTPDAGRTREVKGGGGITPIPAKRKWALTGTPILNRPIEIWAVLKWIGVPWAATYHEFGVRYAKGARTPFGWVYRGASNIPELREKLSDCMLRRTKDEVLTELPKKIRQLIELEVDGAGRAALAAEQKALTEHYSYSDSVADLDFGGCKIEDLADLAKLRQTTALAKLPAAVKYIRDLLEVLDKVIIFAWHSAVIDALMSAFEEFGAVAIDGRVSMSARQKAVDSFQQNPKTRVFVGQIKAAGVGLTLTAANCVCFVEESWVPGDVSQAEDRAHRFGQRDTVLVYHLVLNGSIDAMLVRAQERKNRVIEALLS